MIWQFEHNPAYSHDAGCGAPGYLSPAQATRWQRLRMARMLFEGRHRHYYLHDGRTQFDYPESRAAGDRVVRLYLTLNLLRLVSLKTADLLFGAKPKLDAPTVQQTDRL